MIDLRMNVVVTLWCVRETKRCSPGRALNEDLTNKGHYCLWAV